VCVRARARVRACACVCACVRACACACVCALCCTEQPIFPDKFHVHSLMDDCWITEMCMYVYIIVFCAALCSLFQHFKADYLLPS
jgi:hypothetical protein